MLVFLFLGISAVKDEAGIPLPLQHKDNKTALFLNNLAGTMLPMLPLRYSALDLKAHCHIRPAAPILTGILSLIFSDYNP
jgi:hypothetical protein